MNLKFIIGLLLYVLENDAIRAIVVQFLRSLQDDPQKIEALQATIDADMKG